MLTISHNETGASLAKDRFRPYLNFLSIFKDSLQNKELKEKIFKATRIIFTKTTETLEKYGKKMEGIIAGLKNPALANQEMKN